MDNDVEVPENGADLASMELELDGFSPVPSEPGPDDGSVAGGEASSGGQPEGAEPGAAEAAPAQGAVVEAAGTGPRFRVGDREYTIDELIKQPDVLAKVATQTSQLANYQRLADERAAKIAELEKAQTEEKAAPPAAVAPGPELTLEQQRAFFLPQVKKLQDGARGPQVAEFAAELPDVYADYLADQARTTYFAQVIWKELTDLKKSIHGVVGEASRLTEEAENEAFRTRYNTMLDGLAKDQLFEGLGKPEQRTAFTQFFAQRFGNLDDKDVDDQLVAEAYLGWLYRTAPQIYRAMVAKADQGGRGRAGGEIGSGRGAPAPAEDEMSKAERELDL